MIIPEYAYKPTPEQLAEDFANLDNHQMLAFFEAVTTAYKRDCKRQHFALMDQFIAVVNDADISQDTLTVLACLVRNSQWKLDHYKAAI